MHGMVDIAAMDVTPTKNSKLQRGCTGDMMRSFTINSGNVTPQRSNVLFVVIVLLD
jgi:hypothetical protein